MPMKGPLRCNMWPLVRASYVRPAGWGGGGRGCTAGVAVRGMCGAAKNNTDGATADTAHAPPPRTPDTPPPTLHLVRAAGWPILQQLRLEEALLRADKRNWWVGCGVGVLCACCVVCVAWRAACGLWRVACVVGGALCGVLCCAVLRCAALCCGRVWCMTWVAHALQLLRAHDMLHSARPNGAFPTPSAVHARGWVHACHGTPRCHIAGAFSTLAARRHR